MLVILALISYIAGRVATICTLFLTALITARSHNPVTFVPIIIAGLWITGTVDFGDLTDGPIRMDANGILVGTGRGIPPALSNGSDGPAWWIATAAAACFATTYAGFAALSAMY